MPTPSSWCWKRRLPLSQMAPLPFLWDMENRKHGGSILDRVTVFPSFCFLSWILLWVFNSKKELKSVHLHVEVMAMLFIKPLSFWGVWGILWLLPVGYLWAQLNFCPAVNSFNVSGVCLLATLLSTAYSELLDVIVCAHWVFPERKPETVNLNSSGRAVQKVKNKFNMGR